MNKSLTSQTISGVNWSLIKTYSKTVINIMVGVVLARLLPPSDFGLLGMTVIFTGLADLFSTMGMSASIIRVKELNKTHIRIATSSTIILGLLVYSVFYLSAPYIAEFYNELRLVSILRVLSITFILKGLSTVSYGQIMRRIDFKSILQIELGAFIFGYASVSIVLAFLGYGVWSLVIGRLTSTVISNVITLIKQPPSFGFVFKKKEFIELFSFGTGLSISKLLNYTAANIDYLIIGKFMNSFQLGLYQRSFNLMTLPINQISSSIYNVLFPAFSKVQDQSEKLKIAYLRTVKTTVFLLFPILTLFGVGGEYVIIGLYGENWRGAIGAFQILVFAGFFRSTLSYSGAIAHATGKIYVEVSQQVIYLITLTVGVLIGVNYGIEGASVAVVFALMVLFFLQSKLAMKIANVTLREFALAFLPGLSISVIVLFANLIFITMFSNIETQLPYPIMLLILICVSILAYIISVIYLPQKIKGDVVSWVFEKYNRLIPNKFLKFYENHN